MKTSPLALTVASPGRDVHPSESATRTPETGRGSETVRGSPSSEVGGKRCNSEKLPLRRESSRGSAGSAKK